MSYPDVKSSNEANYRHTPESILSLNNKYLLLFNLIEPSLPELVHS
jgi:hypothetical protein